MVLLLALTVASLNPTVHEQTSALEDETTSLDGSEKPDALDSLNNSENTENSSATTSEASVHTEEDDINYDEQISPQDVTPATPTATITISKADGAYGADQNAATWVSGAGVAYRSHNVTVKAQDVMDYNLVISYANNVDRMSLVGGDAALLGAGDKTPTEMGYNSWGYAWTDTSAAEASLTYKTMPKISAGDTLESKMTYSEDFTKKLVFAAKFGSDATPGTYHTEVMLSLTASPQVVATTIKDIFQMQQMTPEICASTNIGEVAYLQDNRGGGYDNSAKPDMKTYMVKKLSDGNCWMTQNLNLINKEITSTDSNVTSNYTIPASALWSNPSSTSDYQKQEGAYYNGGVNGAHYTWLTATAGTTKTGSANATSDICPKGWRLPTGNTSGEFQALYNQGSTIVGKWSNGSTTAGYNLGNSSFSVNGSTVDGSGFFPAAGNVYDGSLIHVGSDGRYWSGTAGSSTGAYYLYFGSSYVTPSGFLDRFYGNSVRCVAPAS